MAENREPRGAIEAELDPVEYTLRKRLPHRLPRRPNDIYVNMKTDFKAQLARCQKLLDGGSRGQNACAEIYIHGLGLAINRAINIALQLQAGSFGSLQVAANTSTVELVDELEPETDSREPLTRIRNNSAIHIRVFRVTPKAYILLGIFRLESDQPACYTDNLATLTAYRQLQLPGTPSESLLLRERPTLLLLLLSLLLLPLGLPVLCAPPRLICDSRVLERYILEAREAENVTMGCAEGPRLSENITVPDTKVNFNAWKRMEVQEQAVEVWQGLALLSEAILHGQALLANSSQPSGMLQLHIDKAISGLRSLTSLLRVLGAQKESISPPDATPPAPLRTLMVENFCKLFRVYSNFLRGKLKLYTGEACRRGDSLDSDAAGGGCLGPGPSTCPRALCISPQEFCLPHLCSGCERLVVAFSKLSETLLTPSPAILTKCDFEDNTRPLCDWSQMSSDDGDWIRMTGPSPNGTSGPPGGYPNGEGYYLHMDASTFPRGGVARLRSPDIWEQGPLCIHFAFHMFGLSWGAQLRLMLLRGRRYHRPNMLWKYVNTQSPSWMPTTVTVPADRDIPSWLMFEGMRGNTAYLDISLDGLSIRKGTCNQSEFLSLSGASPSPDPCQTFRSRVCMSQMCNFDALNNLCGWSWVPTATGAKWTQKKGSSGILGVGPDDDFSSPGSGYYMLLDPTNARPGQKAVLLSPLSHSSGCLTLSFQYIMRGLSAGEGLFAYASFLGSIRKHTLFSGHRGLDWQSVSVNYTGQGMIQFIVVGVFGEKPEPAIAVDSISISPCGGEHYIYFDSAMVPEVRQSARLVSPPFCAPGDVCVEFAYHMYGLGDGTTLKLLLGSPAGSSPISLWKRVGSQSTGWVNSSVTILKGHQQPMELLLEATRGTSTAFVIAVNYILISHGPCRAKIKLEGPASSLFPETTTVSTEETMASTERISIPPEETTTPTTLVTAATEVATFTLEVTTVTAKESTVSPEEDSVPPEEIIPTEVTTVLPEQTSVPPEETTTSPEVTTVSTAVVTAATEVTIVTSEVTTVSHEETSVPPKETTTSPEVTTVSTAVVTAATEVTIVTSEVTTVSHEETSVPPEETTTSPEVTTVPTEPGEEWFSPNCTERCRCLPGSRMECQISQCATDTACLLKRGEYECQPYGSATCLVYGDLHFVTFDERHISFTGTCTYILAQTCDNSTDSFFKITASTQERGVEGISSLDRVFITLPETTITMTSGRQTLIGDQRVTLPVIPSNNIYVGLSGRFVELRTTFGLRVKWDGDQQLFMTVPSTYSRKLCGLCGNYDGDSSNDNQKPDGTRTQDGDELGKSWQLKEEENKEACLFHMKASFFLDNCVSDMCSFQGLQQMLCTHMSAMTAVCQDAGYAVRPWRRPQFCRELGPKALGDDLAELPVDTDRPCPKKCVEACECEPGFVLSGFECVPRIQCGCTSLEGRYFKVQEQWFNPDCKEICTCDGNNNVRCRPWKCRAQEVCSHRNGLGGAAVGKATGTACTSGRSSSQERDRHIREKPRGTRPAHPGEEPVRNTTGTSGQQYPSEVPGEESSENLLRTLKQEREEQRSPGEGRKSEKMLPAGGLEPDSSAKIQCVRGLSEDMSRDLSTAFNGRCQNPNTYQGAATCIASGDPHYLTFDGALHHFMGTCTYVLTQPCWSNAHDNNFVVSVTNEVHDGNLEVSSVKAVHVQVFDLKVSLFKGRTVVLNNQRVALPVWPLKGRVTIRLSGIFVLLYTNFGLQVRYDGKHLVEVTVPSLYAGFLCGLCGNYNNNSLDDNLRPDGKPAGNSLLLGAAWKILEASEPGCFVVGGKSSSCQENSMDDAWTKKCAILMNPIGPFSNCHEAVPPQASFSSCVYSQCGTKGDILALCRSLQAYASLCAQAGQVITWRNSTFCPTCLTLSSPRDCPTLPCVEGCECQTGHILSGTTCVPLRQCGCSDQDGSYHLLGESWYTEKTCTTLCTCSVHSNVTCNQTACEANHVCLRQNGLLRCAAEMGECHISEDSQIVSFDGHSHPIQDMCTYVMVKVCHPSMNLPFFTISAKADQHTHTKPKTFGVYQLYIDIFSFRVTLQKHHSVLINDTLVTLPATTQIPGVSITTEDVYTIVTIKDEVQVKFESNNFLDIKIPASSNGKVCGVCGNFNGEEEDELMMSSDELAQDEQEFMESWADKHIDPSCQKIEEQNIQVEQQEIMNGNCRPADFEKAQANCKTALQGPTWAQCASRVSLKPFLLGCMNNFCEFRELFRALCEALQSFQDACQKQGLKPPIWRNSSFCPLECPPHSHYTNCLPSCPPSCLDPNSRCEGSGHKVPFTCKEGCICQPGYVLNNDKCVLKTHCGCKDAQGVFVPEGKNWISSSCTQNCVCIGGAIECQNFQCPSGAQCQDNEDGSSKCVKITLQCPAHSLYTNCLPACPPSCSNLDGHCSDTNPKGPFICKEGCLCHPGFVLDKNKCVPRTHCGCKDTQGAFIPTGKTWMSTGCTQSCACMRGAIRCRNFQCPPGTHCKDSNDGSSNCVKISKGALGEALQCPAHSQYTDCLPSCLPSCLDPEGHCESARTRAPSACKEGCVCQPGFVLHDDKCVLRTECSCQDTQGAFIPVGKSWISRGCSQSCNCMGGVIRCQKFKCPSGTFCLDNEDYTSNCVEITMQCPAHSHYTNCVPSCLASCSDPEGHCEGISTRAPSTCKEGCVCDPGFVLHDGKCVLTTECGCKDAQGALIPADKTWINRGCTQTCTCVGGAIHCRNFQCPPGTYCKDIEDGNSKCIKISKGAVGKPSCTDPDGRCVGSSTKGPSTCKEGCVCESGYMLNDSKCVLRNHCGCKDAQGALIPADKTWINRGCTQSCTCVGGVILCRNFQCPSGTYCKDIADGNSNCTKITMQCPAHSHYTNCVPSCLASCSDPEGHCEGISTRAPSTCKEGCVCEPGFVLHDGKCVLRTECGCKDAQGALIPAGKTWISRDCTQSCACTGGTIQCQNFQCPPGTHCKDNNDGSSNCAKISKGALGEGKEALQCPDNSHYTDCLPSCPPSCLDLEGHCEGTSPKVPSTCKEGCLCNSGFVLNKDKCIPRIQCDCKDAQGALIPAGKTWTPRGCTESCTCTGGTVQCQNFQCPSETYCKDNDEGNSNCVKITLQCPAHSHFTDCLPSCPPSCFDPDGRCEGTSPKVPSCKEGCLCQPGYVLGNDKCVLKIECDCKDAQGALVPAGKTWISAGCTQNCTCVEGAIQCRNFQCPQGTHCKGSNDGSSNCAEIPLQCPAHSHFTSCLPSCPPSCSIMDGHCEESSSKVPATCKEGCVCQPGYLLNNDKCVLRIQCGCRDAQGDLIPAGKTWLNRDCTESCNCMGGTIQCRTFRCPLGTDCKDSNNGSYNCVKISKRVTGEALQCPAHSRYTNCLPPCPPSCTDLDGHCEGTSPKVPSTCKEGCVCQPGYVLHNNRCVLQMHCDCRDARGDLIPAGKTWVSSGCTQSCTCMGGVVQCRSFNCPPGTQCQNGPDGNINCTKIVNVKCPAHSRYTHCLPSCPPSCSDPEGLCGGTIPKAPSTCKEGCVCRSGFVLHDGKCILRIQCSCRDDQGVLIPADKTWLSKDCTQNCTCLAGDIRCRNFQCPTGTHCKDSDDGSHNCAKADKENGEALQCPDHGYHTSCLPSCIPSCSNLKEHCEVTSLKDPSTCKEGCLCQSGFVFNRDKCVPRIECDCKDSQGALIPVTGQCPAHSRYTSCLPSCLPSCLDPDGLCKDTSPRASPTCKEGCICQSGYILSGDKCIPRTQCSCKDAQGNLILAGKTWISSGCTQSCACINGTIQCQKFSCPSETHCQHSDDGSSNCAANTFQCPAHSHFTNCLPSCLPSCLNPDGHCEGTSTKVPAVCNAGCLCQPGYVLNNDECVPRIQCGCKDVQGTLIPENKTWITGGCTQSCTCRGGTVQCHNFKCPTGSHCEYNKDGSRSCVTSEGLCQGSSPRVPSPCKEGCVCRSGYVLHDNKCVLRIHCGCKDARGNLIQTGQTWISTDCTRICACKEGLFQCQNFQCPSGTHCQQYQDGSSNCVSDTLKCPANSLYTSCLPSCLPSCSNPKGHCEGVSPKDSSTCKEGCVCRPDYLLSEDKCVPRNQCGCKDAKGDLIPIGKTWLSSGCTQSCTCVDGAVQCRNFSCPTGSHCQHSDDGSSNCAANKLEKCTIFGDPYYHTFDGFSYRFLGRMNYYLIKTVDKLPEGMEHLVIEGRNKISPKGSPTLHEVTTNVYGYKIQLQEGLVALVNNQKVAIPYNPNDRLGVFLRAQRLFLLTDFEMVVDFDGKHTAVISLPTMYRGLIRGLCGNYDKDRANDLMLPSGTLTSNINAFGNSWEVKMVKALLRLPRALPEEGGEEESDPLPSECSPEQTALLSSTQACRVVVDPQGPFAACHQIVAPEPFEQHCMSDVCTGWKTKEEEEFRCRVLSGYAIICQEAGANTTGWRDQTHCAMTCPASTVYQPCMTPCPASCAKFVTPKACEGPCMEGCATIPGYIYSDTQSLPVTQCGCTTNGLYYKLGDSYVTDDCSQHCTCASQGTLLCEPYGCRAGEACTVANFTRGCFRDSPCLQNPCHNDGRCQEQGDTFICHCDLGYGGELCTEPRDIPSRKKLAQASSPMTTKPSAAVDGHLAPAVDTSLDLLSHLCRPPFPFAGAGEDCGL
ncbi:hypothetical protein ACRRTK_008499 [Alexandromys fortis]